MSHFQILKPPPLNVSISVEELRQRLQNADKIAHLAELAKVLAGLPPSETGQNVAREIKERLAACLVDHALPESFPMEAEAKSGYQKQSAAWLYLAQAYAGWLSTSGGEPAGQLLSDALFCLRQVVTIAGICHWPLLKGLWADVHRLYRMGKQKRIVQQSKRRHRNDSYAVAKQAYIHLLMLGLVDLAALRPIEIRWLDALLEKWVSQVRLVKDAEAGWGLDVQGDQVARWSKGQSRPRLDFTELMSLLDSHLSLAQRNGRFQSSLSVQTIDLELVQLWRRSWETGAGPSEANTLKGPGELVFGLTGVFHRMRGEVIPGSAVKSMNGWITVQKDGVQVGDLAGLFDPGSRRLQAVAVVDRLYAVGMEGSSISLQLRLLADRVHPVGVQPLYGRFQSYQPALLLQDGKSRLLLPSQPLREGTLLRLLHGDSVYPVRLGGGHYPALGVLGFTCESAARQIQK